MNERKPIEGLMLPALATAARFGQVIVQPKVNVKMSGSITLLLGILIFLVLLLPILFVVIMVRMRGKK